MKEKKLLQFIFVGIMGFLVALIIYGSVPLDVTNDKWIYNGYIEPDIIQHYAGWMNYRNSEWCFPIGKIQGVGDYSNYISFTDSIPLFAIVFKLLRCFLPATFQYFGIYIFMCFILQALFSYKILDQFIKSNVYKCVGALLFLFSPVMIERSFRHTALASHWLILLSIYLYIKSRKSGKLSTGYILTLVLSILIHPYFVPMVCAFMLANTLEQFVNRNKEENVRLIVVWLVSLIVLGAVGYSIGLFGWISTIKSNSIGAYGFFTTDLNSIINPVSQGYQGNSIPRWSIILPVRSFAINTLCDGFNYWGLGVLISFPVVLIVTLRKKLVDIKEYWGYILILILLIIYGYSNTIWKDGNVIFSYNIPEFLYPIVSSFKSSGRYLWPVTYSVVLFIEIEVYRIFSQTKYKNNYWLSSVLMGLIVIFQIIDMSKVITSKHQFFDKDIMDSIYASYDLYNSFDKYIDENNRYAIICDPSMDPALMYKLSYLLGKYHVINNVNIMNRGDIYDLQKESGKIVNAAVMAGHLDPRYMYIFREKNNAKAFVNCLTSDCEIMEVKESNGGNAYTGVCTVYLVKEKNNVSDKHISKDSFDNYYGAEGNHNIEKSEIKEDSIFISGWAYIEGMDSDNQIVYASVQYNSGSTILLPAIKVTRSDVAYTFESENYSDSGFSFCINQEIDKIKNIVFIIVNGDKIYYVN